MAWGPTEQLAMIRRGNRASNLGDLARGDLFDFLLQGLLAQVAVVDGALVVLGESVQVAKCVRALAVSAE